MFISNNDTTWEKNEPNCYESQRDLVQCPKIQNDHVFGRSDGVIHPENQDITSFLDSLYLDLDNIYLGANGYSTRETKNVDPLIFVNKIKSLNELVTTKNRQIQVKDTL